MDDNRLIGKKDSSNGMPWNNKEDLKHFKETTIHQTILMGYTTYQAIGRPLPHRHTIVVSFEPNEALFETEWFGVKRSCTVLDFLVVDLKQSRQVGLKGRANDRVVHFSILLRCAIPFRNSGKLARKNQFRTESRDRHRVRIAESHAGCAHAVFGTHCCGDRARCVAKATNVQRFLCLKRQEAATE